MEKAETGARKNQRIRKLFVPTKHRRELPPQRKRVAMLFNQVGGSLYIGNSQRMSHCLGEHVVLLVPAAGTTVEFGHFCWLRLLQAVLQHLGKQMVIAIPLPLVVQCVDEQVGPL